MIMYVIYSFVVISLIMINHGMVKASKKRDAMYERLIKKKFEEGYNINENHPLIYTIENGTDDKFSDWTAIYGYPNYLFRSDSKQRWTTEKVTKNICIWGDDMQVQFFAEDIEERIEMRKKIIEKYEEFAKGTNIYSRKFRNKIRFFTLRFINSDLYQVDVEMDEVMQSLVMAILKKLQNNENCRPVCAVIHLDEELSHVHFIYVKNNSKTKISIQEIL